MHKFINLCSKTRHCYIEFKTETAELAEIGLFKSRKHALEVLSYIALAVTVMQWGL